MRIPRFFVKTLILLSLFLLFSFFTYPYFLKKMAYFLILEQRPDKADAIVVLNGRDVERSLAAVDLFEKGYANLIVLARGLDAPGSDEFSKRVGKTFEGKIFFQRAVESMGIPKNSFKLIGDGIRSTYGEAKVTKQFLTENGYKSILLVTSKWHSKRAYLTFQSTLNKKENGIKITIISSKYDNFDPEAWWKKEEDAVAVFREYVRLIYYLLAFRISPLDMISSK